MAPYYRNPPNQADWTFWVKMPHVELWQAIALSMGFEPGDDYSEFSSAISGGTHKKDFDRRFQLAEAHVRNSSLKLFAWPRNARIEYALVDLRTFGAFAKRMELDPPSDLPVDPVD